MSRREGVCCSKQQGLAVRRQRERLQTKNWLLMDPLVNCWAGWNWGTDSSRARAWPLPSRPKPLFLPCDKKGIFLVSVCAQFGPATRQCMVVSRKGPVMLNLTQTPSPAPPAPVTAGRIEVNSRHSLPNKLVADTNLNLLGSPTRRRIYGRRQFGGARGRCGDCWTRAGYRFVKGSP